MGYVLQRGKFVIRYPDLPSQGPEPDGDTVKFRRPTHQHSSRRFPAGQGCATLRVRFFKLPWLRSAAEDH
jgi:hypothetical protein